MRINSKFTSSAAYLIATGFALTGAPTASYGQGSSANEPLEEVVTIGSRRAERTASDSPVPIDVVSGDDFQNIGNPDMDDMLRNILPSYNVTRQPISDAATLVRPATMRGLPPDNVLVLVNGKRRHRSAVIADLGGSLAAGSQGADLASIPALALKQVEVLRDGASAQYGSDAIAGVMNFVLNDASEGFTVEARVGEFFEGDGGLTQIGANAGFALGQDGFANLTFQWREADPTDRSLQRTDAATLLRSGNPQQQSSILTPAQVWGAPEFSNDWNVFLNAAIPTSNRQEAYFFGNVGRRETEGGFFYRNPNNRSGTYTNNGIRAVVDTRIGGPVSDPDSVPLGTTNYVSNCPALPSPGSGGSGDDLDAQAVADDFAALQNLPANCWVLNSVLPGGYTPQFGGKLDDISGTLGIRGDFANGMTYDFSATLGQNAVDFFINNSWNPSMGPDAIVGGVLKQDFDIGRQEQTDTSINADFSYPIQVDAFASDLNFAFGAEWREEQFETIIGEIDSWDAGRFAFQNPLGANNTYSDGTTPLPNLSIGSHGFAGFGPAQAGRWDRSNWAAYVDFEADVVESLTLGAAIRFEDFSDFGTTTNGKLSARWQATDTVAFRGSASTGFRAPTPGQSNVTKISTVTIDGELQQRGQVAPTNPVAQFLGAEPLDAEEATNYTLGVVWDVTDNLNVAVDFYRIELDDRISQTGTIFIEDEPVPADLTGDCPGATNLAQCLSVLGVPGADDLTSISYYTNDFETTTTGADLVLTYSTDWGRAGNGDLTVAWNWTDTEVEDAGDQVTRDRVVELENFNPEHRGIFTYNHFINNFRFLVRASYYDDWTVADWEDDPTDRGTDGTGFTIDCTAGLFRDNCYDGAWIFDIEAAYTFADRWTAVVGAQNVADDFGPRDIDNLDGTINSGNAFTTSSPFGFDGGFWYARLRVDF